MFTTRQSWMKYQTSKLRQFIPQISRIIPTRQVVALTLTVLFKFCLKSADILLHLHTLFWLTDFLLPKCCHGGIITQPVIKSISISLQHLTCILGQIFYYPQKVHAIICFCIVILIVEFCRYPCSSFCKQRTHKLHRLPNRFDIRSAISL